MSITKIPSYTGLADQQYVQVTGPDGLISGFFYDSQTRSLRRRESSVINPSFHGVSHIAEDPIPGATCDTAGLMSADDKCKLDSLLQTKIGVLGFQGAGFCVVPGCRVLMADGTRKPIEEVQPGDVVIGHSGIPRVVEKVHQRTIDEAVYGIDCRRHCQGGLKVTGDHKVLAMKRDAVKCVRPDCKARDGLPCRHNSRNCAGCQYSNIPRAVPQWVKAKDLAVGDFVVSRCSSALTNPMPTLRVLDHVDGMIADGRVFTKAKQIKVFGSQQPDGTARICTTSKTSLPEELPLTPDFLKLCGYYLAEGSSGKKRLSFAIHQDELVDGDIGGDIRYIMLSLFGVLPTIKTDDSKGIELVYRHATLARLLGSLLGHGSKLKRIPRVLMELPPNLQKYILIGLFRGDGSSRNTYSTKNMDLRLANQELVEQAAALLERCGAEPSLAKPCVKNDPWQMRKGRQVKRTSYKVAVQASGAPWLWEALGKPSYTKPNSFALEVIQGDHHLSEVRAINVENYSGVVYDLSIADDHSYVVNGLVIHNSDDGGWMQGPIIFAAGSEFISLERFGNIIRWTVDAPIPLNCGIEACAAIYFVQDETEIASIRPPVCAGKLPGLSGYGELKFYLMPESMIVDSSNPSRSLATKGQYPSLIFKRYDDAVTPGTAEFELVLKRNQYNSLETSIGWAMTPGAGSLAECVWFLGQDTDGNQITFQFEPDTAPGMLGALLYKGHLLTKKVAVISGYPSHVLSTNQYTCRWWDVLNARPVSESSFTATNIWQYTDVLGGANARQLSFDRTVGLLEVGTLVDVWFYQIGEVAGDPIRRYFFSKKPDNQIRDVWTQMGGVEFGTVLDARLESNEVGTGTARYQSESVDDLRNFDKHQWGLTGIDSPVMLYDSAGTAGISDDLADEYKAEIDTTVPALVVNGVASTTSVSQRPVYLWNRSMMANCLATVHLGRPDPMRDGSSNPFPPYDILLGAPIDSHDQLFMKVVGKGAFTGSGYYLLVKGVNYKDLPKSGTIRLLSGTRNSVWSFSNKLLYPAFDDDAVALVSDVESVAEIGDVAELAHQDYGGPCVRLQFSWDGSGVKLQFKVGTLDMATGYEEDASGEPDSFVRGLAAGYAVSAEYVQAAAWDGVSAQPAVNVDGFYVYDGGMPPTTDGSQDEVWNELEIMQREGQVWIWWNGLLIPPSSELSAVLDTPVAVTTPYFPVTQISPIGKFGLRLFPGARVRRVLLRSQSRAYSEYTRGQIDIV